MQIKKNKEKIHIVIYSKLEKYGGGRETWADYFLKYLDISGEFASINIYCLGSENYSDTLIKELQDYKNICFFPTKVKNYNNGFSRMKSFLIEVQKNLKNNSSNGEVVLFLGAMMEGITALFIKLVIGHKLKVIIWIRSIGLKEISTRRNKIVVSVLSITEKMVFKISDAIIFNGKDTFEYYKKIYIKLKDKMHVVENAVDFNLFSKIDRVQLKDDSINVAYIGRFNREKGFYDFLESINLYNEKFMDNTKEKIKFHIWGFGSEFELPSNTTNHGILKRDKILEVLSNIQILVFLNLSKSMLAGGLSHGLLEALASGRICIAYDNPAHNQVLNSTNSILISEGDIEGLANAYFEIVKNVMETKFDEYSKIASSGLETAEEYSIERHINKFMKVYLEIC